MYLYKLCIRILAHVCCTVTELMYCFFVHCSKLLSMCPWSSKGTVQTSSPSSVGTVMIGHPLLHNGEWSSPCLSLPWCNVHCSSSNRTHRNHYWSGHCTSVGWICHPVCVWISGQPHQEQCRQVLLHSSWSVLKPTCSIGCALTRLRPL